MLSANKIHLFSHARDSNRCIELRLNKKIDFCRWLETRFDELQEVDRENILQLQFQTNISAPDI